MNDFESERAAKAARFRQLAKKHANIATGRHFAARERLEMIPLGQPILVGHHSEKRHRKDLTRIDEHFAKAKEHHDKAEYFRRRSSLPNYALTNNLANIRRLEKRLAAIQNPHH